MLPHLDAAYTLARYLTRHEHDAQDVVQDAYLRALKYFDGFRGDVEGADGRAWLLTIVRNTAMDVAAPPEATARGVRRGSCTGWIGRAARAERSGREAILRRCRGSRCTRRSTGCRPNSAR